MDKGGAKDAGGLWGGGAETGSFQSSALQFGGVYCIAGKVAAVSVLSMGPGRRKRSSGAVWVRIGGVYIVYNASEFRLCAGWHDRPQRQ